MSGRRLWTLMRREVRATLRDPFTLTILITVPLAALVVFGFVLSTEVKDMALGVLDADGSPTSRRFIADLGAQGTFVPRTFATREAMDEAIVTGEIGAAIVIPPDFEREFVNRRPGAAAPQIQVVYDGAEALLAGNAEGFLGAIASTTAAALASERQTAAAAGVEVVSRALFNPTLDGTPFMVAGTFGFVLSFLTTLITAVSIVNEKLTGTFEQLQITPATSVEILLGKLLPLGAVFAFDVLLMVLVAGFLLGVWPHGSIAFFVVMSAFYVLVSLAMGLVISATSDTAAEAVQKSVMTSIPLVQLSGFAFPIASMPTGVQWLAEVFPATHYIRISRAIYLRGEGPLDLAGELGILLVFALLMMGYALRSIEARR